jgi:hypothetical protein
MVGAAAATETAVASFCYSNCSSEGAFLAEASIVVARRSLTGVVAVAGEISRLKGESYIALLGPIVVPLRN